jgi:pimeloyl-ACP methyl ester carboxylesterase
MPRRAHAIVFAFCLLVPCVVPAQEASLAGTWIGAWVRAGEPLQVVFHFKQEANGWSGSFDSDQLRVVGIPLRDIRVGLPTVTWKIAGDETTTNFAGELHANRLTGKFEDDGDEGTFAFQRAVEEQQPEEREVTFRNGDTTLAGSVLLPKNARSKAPGIVFLHGSGAEGRWASRYLAMRFARAGFAALIWDKRGVGKSQGDWRTATLDDFAGDAVAAVEQLRSIPEVDAGRVGIHGHSQGGTLAPLIATKAPHVAFIIGSSASGLSAEEVEIYSIENSLDLASLSKEEASAARNYICLLVTTAYSNLPHQQLLERWQQVKGKPWAIEPPPEADDWWSWSRQWAQYDPLVYWREVRMPVLLVYGANDQRVPARASAAAITNVLMNGVATSLTVNIFPNADHTLRVKSRVWPITPVGYPEIPIDWARRVTAAAR